MRELYVYVEIFHENSQETKINLFDNVKMVIDMYIHKYIYIYIYINEPCLSASSAVSIYTLMAFHSHRYFLDLHIFWLVSLTISFAT